MVDEAHGSGERDTGPVQPGDVGDPQAVKRNGEDLQTMKKILKATRWLKRKFVRVCAGPDRVQDGDQCLGQWAGKGSGFPSLRRLNGDNPTGEINERKAQARFPQAQAGVQADEKGKAQPLGLVRQGGEAGGDFGVGEFAFLGGFVPADAEALNGIRGDLAAQQALAEELAEEFHFDQGGVFRAGFVAGARASAEGDVIVAVAVGDLFRVGDGRGAHPVLDVPPVQAVGGQGARGSAVAGQPVVNPRPIVGRRAVADGAKGEVRAVDLSLGGFAFGVDAELGGLAYDPAGGIGVTDPPERRTRAAVKGGHAESVSVCNVVVDGNDLREKSCDLGGFGVPFLAMDSSRRFDSDSRLPLFISIGGVPSVLCVLFRGGFFAGGVR